MAKIGIFFGTDSGGTRLIAKTIAKKLGDHLADKPLNVNRIGVDDMLQYDVLILGTPTYGEGQLPGKSSKIVAGSWEEFLPQLKDNDLAGKTVAIYGLGDQLKYSERFADSLYLLYSHIIACGARVIGDWGTENYEFQKSRSVVDGKFVGLILDQSNQRLLTEGRIDAWLAKIKPELMGALETQAAAV
jgi:flavodoxin I